MKHEAISAAMALTALLLTGCASPPQMQEKFGKSLAALKAAQIGTSDSRRSDLEALDGLAAEMVPEEATVEWLRHRCLLRG